MQIPLNKGERLRLDVGDGTKKHVRVKAWQNNNCICVSYSNHRPLECGTLLEMEGMDDRPKSTYYVQFQGHPHRDNSSVLLRRNPAAGLNQRRNTWRVPFTGATAIRQKGAKHFLSAQFADLNMEAARLLSEVKLSPGVDVELQLNLPDYPGHVVSGITVRTSESPVRTNVYGKGMYGLVVRFESLSGPALRHLTFFMWQRVRKTYPQQMRQIFETTHRQRTTEATTTSRSVAVPL